MSPRSRRSPAPPPLADPPRTLVVSCPDWPVTAAGYGPESLVVVVSRERVVAASAHARRLGVRPSQRRREAQSHCPELTVLRRDESAELRAFEPVLVALEAFGAPVALGSAGRAELRMKGPARYFGGEEAFVGLVAEALEEVLAPQGGPATPRAKAPRGPGADPVLVGATWRIGVADGSFAALLAALEGRIVAPGQSSEFLAGFPVEVLERPELTDLLRHLGIYSLGAFVALGERDVLSRFGVEGARLQGLARGLGEQRLTPRVHESEFVAEVTLEPPIERSDEAAFAVRALAQDLGARLAGGGLACTLLEVSVQLSDGEKVVRRWSHDGPFGASLIAERLRFQLEVFLLGRSPLLEDSPGLGSDEVRGITRLRLEAVEVVADRGRQSQLWGRPAWTEEHVERTFARLQGIAGPEAVLRPVLVGGRGPLERARLVAFGEALPPGQPSPDLPWPGQLPAPSPALVVSESLPVEVLDGRDRHLVVNSRGVPSAAPESVALDGGPAMRVIAWGGPWPADEHWWDPMSRRRRARIQVLLDNGEAYLLALEQGRWSLEGRYD